MCTLAMDVGLFSNYCSSLMLFFQAGVIIDDPIPLPLFNKPMCVCVCVCACAFSFMSYEFSAYRLLPGVQHTWCLLGPLGISSGRCVLFCLLWRWLE